ncbi:uncharacterized protein SPPG_03771 [Spizellomyces punctatus DAOM BR117]|uniref:FAD/NAD(P)-binding domain-containing protein n=1 Tax=Spizellomyces punctatus (strain DAOM BR117) TaxID=645134 RepID=A0A0L0HIE8_SPIPD|nr:uncharacterized protein SPPG_03771 [Spizellomyces punctatus DAOM BR117]KND00645.1 hypothetical protein SPPG_03771 [Spizellomyces punctatus DAOM BR117]|eukprot:XP_016608684.1 hypothetical protein SPPG_03771 [Spizellomyces punctatus DAOM BR117]
MLGPNISRLQRCTEALHSVPFLGPTMNDAFDTCSAVFHEVSSQGLAPTLYQIASHLAGERKQHQGLPLKGQEVIKTAQAVDIGAEEYKNIVIIGGSIFGIATAMKVRYSLPLPKNYRLIIIEKHSHMHYMFAFPRASVIPGFEKELFAPYDNLFKSAKEGRVIQACATSITPTHVELDRSVDGFGTIVPYEYLLYGAGAKHPRPGCLSDENTKEEGVTVLKEYQARIGRSDKVLVVGGGAVGLELAAEIKEHYPEKEVTLVHSRARYLQTYKFGLHRRAYSILKNLGVRQILGDRVIIPPGGFKDDGKEIVVKTRAGLSITTDLQILCTGMIPNSALLSTLSPASINPENKYVLVKPSLQIADPRFPNVFAGGDVVDLPDIKTGISAFAHAAVAIENVVKLVEGREKGLKDDEIKLVERSPVLPQIYLYFGLHRGVAQLSYHGYLYTAGTWLVRKHFSYNVLASRAWDWCGTPLSAETVDI